MSKNFGTTVFLRTYGNTRRRGIRKRNNTNMWSNNDWEIFPINVKPQTTAPGSSENTRQYKCPSKLHLSISYSDYKKIRHKEKNLKKAIKRMKDKNYILLLKNHISKREWCKIFKALRQKLHQLRIMYPVKLSFKSKGDFLSHANVDSSSKRSKLI